MNNYEKVMQDDINHALEPNKYLELVKNESDKEKRYNILKKYFTENITKNVYQNMDLLYSSQANFDQFKNMYVMIAKDLSLKVLLAVDTLVSERGSYQLDLSEINSYNNIFQPDLFDKSIKSDDEYSICQSYITPTKK
ncbi:putative ORFan [Tupanvirus deep ocean]|uniref:ORFan n=2 Tax=Tupanvirus TaxID=2094720 RepID=A0AC62A8T4_9VIRU|nr:putative ORFan [Tupanvirus deep ocean]QKU34191.1 putative ORFan [Tupanvirus deep ocean]